MRQSGLNILRSKTAVVVAGKCLALAGCGTTSADTGAESDSPAPAGEPAKVAASATLNCSEKFGTEPPEEEGELAIAWGNAPSDYTQKLHVSCPDSDAKWMIFAGGYFTRQRKCTSLIVRVDGDEHRVPIAAGAACPDS